MSLAPMNDLLAPSKSENASNNQDELISHHKGHQDTQQLHDGYHYHQPQPQQQLQHHPLQGVLGQVEPDYGPAVPHQGLPHVPGLGVDQHQHVISSNEEIKDNESPSFTPLSDKQGQSVGNSVQVEDGVHGAKQDQHGGHEVGQQIRDGVHGVGRQVEDGLHGQDGVHDVKQGLHGGHGVGQQDQDGIYGVGQQVEDDLHGQDGVHDVKQDPQARQGVYGVDQQVEEDGVHSVKQGQQDQHEVHGVDDVRNEPESIGKDKNTNKGATSKVACGVKTVVGVQKSQQESCSILISRCHICLYVTFFKDRLIKHFWNAHGLSAPNKKGQVTREYVYICEYQANAFTTPSVKIQKPFSTFSNKNETQYSDGEENWSGDEDNDAANDDFRVNVKREQQSDEDNCKMEVKLDPNVVQAYKDDGEEEEELYDEDEEAIWDTDNDYDYVPVRKKMKRFRMRRRVKRKFTDEDKTADPTLPELGEIVKFEPNEAGTDTVGKYKCPECDFLGNDESSVRRHFGRMHVKKSDVYFCEECDYSTKKRQDINNHVNAVHKRMRKHKCGQCMFSTAYKQKLKLHMEKIHRYDDDRDPTENPFFITDESELDRRLDRRRKTKKERDAEDREEKRRKKGKPRRTNADNMTDEERKSLTLNPETNLFTCAYCGYASQKRGHMSEHIKTIHFNKNVYECKFCEYNTPFLKEYKAHNKTIHNEEFNTFHCTMCEYKTYQKHRLNTHKKNAHEKEEQVCPFCNFSVICKEKMETHYQTEHAEKIRHLPIQTFVVYPTAGGNVIHKCHKCEYTSSYPNFMAKHKKVVHNEDYVHSTCSICSYGAQCRVDMEEHLKNVHCGKDYFLCLHCTFSTVNYNEFQEHVKIHPGFSEQNPNAPPYAMSPLRIRRIYKCDTCEYSHTERENLNAHKRLVHKPTAELMCDFCSYRTHWTGNLNRHIKSKHKESRDFLCHLCNFSTSLKFNLQNHMKIHERSEEESKQKRSRLNTGLGVKKKKLLPAEIPEVDGKLQCPKCPNLFLNRKSLLWHYKKQHCEGDEQMDLSSVKSEDSEMTQDSQHSGIHNPHVGVLPPPPPMNPPIGHSLFQSVPGWHMQYINQMSAHTHQQ